MSESEIIEYRLGGEEQEVVDQATRILIDTFGVPTREHPETITMAWAKLAKAGWLHAGLAEESGGFGLSDRVMAAIGIAAGEALVAEEFVTNAVILPALLALADGGGDLLERQTESPAFLLADGRGRRFAAAEDEGSAARWCFGVHRGWDAYSFDPAEDGSVAGLTRHLAPEIEFEPISGLAPDLGAVRLVRGERDSVEIRSSVDTVKAMLDTAEIVHSGAMVGLAKHSLAVAAEYAKDREQFGKPLGSFQSIKHLLADIHVRTLVAETSLFAAAQLGGEASLAGARAKAIDAADNATRAMVQVLGGIGYTWEHEAHWYLKAGLAGGRRFTSREEALMMIGNQLLAEVTA